MGNNNTSAIKEEDYTSEAEKKNRQECLHEDSLKEENQMNPTAKSEYAEAEAAENVSVDTSELGNEISQEDTHEDGVKEDNQNNIPVTSEANAALENAAKASHDTAFELGKDMPPEDATFDHARSKNERDSCEGDTCEEDVNTEKHPTAEGTDVQEIAARLPLHDEASDPKKDIAQEDIHANDKDESASILFGGGKDVPGKSTIFDSDAEVNLRDAYGQERLEVRQPETTPNAEAVEDGGEKCEILSSSSLEVAEDYGKQTELCLRENLSVAYHHHLDSEPAAQEEENTKVLTLDALDMSNEAELQGSPVVDSNHKELVKVLPEPSLSESWPRGDFLDTNPLYSQDDNDDGVTERETQTQEKSISPDKSEGAKPDSPSGNKSNGNLLTKVNYVTDDSLTSLSESVNVANPVIHDFEENYKVLHEERKMSRSGSTIENSHDHSPGECLQEPLNEFNACMVNTKDMTIVSNGGCNGERNEVFRFSDLVITNTDEVEMPKATENGHHFVVPEAEVLRDNYKKKIEEKYKEPEASHAAEKGTEGREMLEQCNSHLVTVEHVESFTLQSSDSLLHIYSYQEVSEDQTKNLTATSMEKTSEWEQANDDKAFEKEKEDYSSQHVEATSTSVFSEQCPNNSTFENGGYFETREGTTRLSTESNPEKPTIFFQIQKSPSFNLNLQNGESSEESDDQSPLLFQDKSATESLSHQNSLHVMDSSWPHSEHDHCSFEHEEMPVEDKIVTMERSYTEKSKAPLLCYSKEDDEASLLVPSEEQGNHAITCKAVKEVTPASPKPKEKRKSKSSFFMNCMCCATVAN